MHSMAITSTMITAIAMATATLAIIIIVGLIPLAPMGSVVASSVGGFVVAFPGQCSSAELEFTGHALDTVSGRN